MKILSPFQERLIQFRFRGLRLNEISEILKRDKGTIRNDFSRIYKVLEIDGGWQLYLGYERYKIKLKNFLEFKVT